MRSWAYPLSIEELKTGAFIDKLENLILYGPVGTGKSHMATAIGVAACSRGKKVKFFRTAALVNLLSEAKAKGELQRFIVFGTMKTERSGT
jgi:DNA replication protein DnaC